MKQRITEDQYNELAEDKKRVWLKWMRDHHYTMGEVYGPSFSFKTDDILGFPSIGEMIEFLSERQKEECDDAYSCSTVWGSDFDIYWQEGIELCDSLWNEVKIELK